MSLESHDFAQPLRLHTDLADAVGRWLSDWSSILIEKWAESIPFEFKLTFSHADTGRAGAYTDKQTDDLVGYRISVGKRETNTLLVMPRTLGIALVAGYMGEDVEELEEDRRLTPSELSVNHLMVEEMVEALKEAWADDDPVAMKFKQEDWPIRRSRAFLPELSIAICHIKFSAKFGEVDVDWVLPQALLSELFVARLAELKAEAKGSEQERIQLQTLVGHMLTELSVVLGRAHLGPNQLSALTPGDVVVLDQRVRDPLSVIVGGKEVFRTWPGRVGVRQACKIDSIVED